MNNTFRTDFIAALRRDWRKRQTDNFDTYRFAAEKASAAWWKRVAIGVGASRIRFFFRAAAILRHCNDIEWTYSHLSDKTSKNWLTSVLSFRALGGKRVKLDSNNLTYWQSIERIERDLVKSRSVQTAPNGQPLHDFDLHQLGIPIVLRGCLGNVLYPFMLNQYRLERDGRTFAATLGDVIIDAGGCYGDTALYFADAVGPAGMVFCYEFNQDNLKTYEHNMLANPNLSDRIRLIERALWSVAGKEIQVRMNGASTHIDPSARAVRDSNTVLTDTIDAMVERLGVAKVDFIKMDIEGAELEALRGAKQTILRDHPKLAICLYHRLDHFWKIPQFIDSLNCGYDLRIKHFTIHAEETVLFAEPRLQ